MPELTAEELEKKRSAAELLPWVEDMLKELGSTEDGKAAGRFRRGLAKQLVEEALPLGIFAMHHYGASEEVSLQLVIGSQNHDAVITDQRSNPSPFSYVEITQAHAGEEEHLRMLALGKHGHVNLLGPVTKTGTKATGIEVEVESVALSHQEVLERQLGLVEAAVLRKTQKKYPEGTALLVVFDDYVAVNCVEDTEILRSRLEPLLPGLSRFDWLVLVGWSKRTFLEFDLRNEFPP